MRIEGEIALDFAAAEDDEDELDSSEEEGLDLAWRGVGLACGAALVVKRADGCAPAGEVGCVMGPSGAGKSSLLRAIGSRGPRRGAPSRSAAASSAARGARRSRRRAGRPGAPPTRTVAEHLLFHARLRRPPTSPRAKAPGPCGACPRAGARGRAGTFSARRRRRGARRAAGPLGRRGAARAGRGRAAGRRRRCSWTSRRRARRARGAAAARARARRAAAAAAAGSSPCSARCTSRGPRSWRSSTLLLHPRRRRRRRGAAADPDPAARLGPPGANPATRSSTRLRGPGEPATRRRRPRPADRAGGGRGRREV